MTRFYQRKDLSNKQLQELALAIQEAKARGIEIPREIEERFEKNKKLEWPIGENGYFLKNNGTLYEPSESQEGFIKTEARFSLFYGSRGSGKTGAGAQKAMRKIMQGESGAVMNPDFENFRYSTWPELKNWIPWKLVVPSQRHRASEVWQPTQPFVMVFMNGAKIYCKGLKSPDSARGPNINWLWYDEAGRDETGLGWRIATASVRVGNNPQAWATATPRPLDHWMYKFFVKKEIPPEVIKILEEVGLGDKILVESFHGTIEQNKTHLDPMFYASILTSYPSGYMRSQEVDGQFANEGGKLGDRNWFNEKIVDADFYLGERYKIYRYWDLAATEKKLAKDDPDETVGSLVAKYKTQAKDKPNYCIEDSIGGFWAEMKVFEVIANVARRDGPYITILIEQEPGASGKLTVGAIKEYFKQFPELRAHKIEGVDVKKIGDRVTAAETLWFSVAADGRMYMRKGSWNEKVLGQVDGFTQIEHDDRVTSITGAMWKLNPFRLWSKVPFVSV